MSAYALFFPFLHSQFTVDLVVQRYQIVFDIDMDNWFKGEWGGGEEGMLSVC